MVEHILMRRALENSCVCRTLRFRPSGWVSGLFSSSTDGGNVLCYHASCKAHSVLPAALHLTQLPVPTDHLQMANSSHTALRHTLLSWEVQHTNHDVSRRNDNFSGEQGQIDVQWLTNCTLLRLSKTLDAVILRNTATLCYCYVLGIWIQQVCTRNQKVDKT